ncbi:MAG TPA: nuclear transport factor 2 family protein [Streptosporangiaceae bacterium]|nr:nuclear transport factor 2 family protein [Streptosporangiaceae bacterium]
MCNQNEWIVREAFLAYARGDVARMMEFVDQHLEWTKLGQARGDAALVRAGRDDLEEALRRLALSGRQAELEEVVASGEKVMLVMRTPGLASTSPQSIGDKTYDVVTVRDGLIVGLRACQDRAAARSLIGIS